jgi:hypothetical protein
MLYGQLSGGFSLRSIELGLASYGGELNHIGISKAPPKSSLAYANATRSPAVFEEVYHQTFNKITSLIYRRDGENYPHKFLFNQKMYSIDSTIIDLCVKDFEWAEYRRNKGGIKLTLSYDNNYGLPSFARVGPAKIADVKYLDDVNPFNEDCQLDLDKVSQLDKVGLLNPGSIVAIDRGYIDFARFYGWDKKNITFVTRTKKGMLFDVLDVRNVPAPVGRPSTSDDSSNDDYRARVISDKVVELAGKISHKKCPIQLRLVEYEYYDKVEKHWRKFTFLTNNLKFSPVTIAQIYRLRWGLSEISDNPHYPSNIIIRVNSNNNANRRDPFIFY